jgi:hypothetical protein
MSLQVAKDQSMKKGKIIARWIDICADDENVGVDG